MRIPDILRNRWMTQTTIISAVATAGGFLIGYIQGLRRFDKEFVVTSIETTVEERTTTVFDLVPTPDPDLQTLLDEEDQIEREAAENAIQTKVTDVVDLEPVHIFTVPDDDWDEEMELSNRHSNEPYIIHQDEYIADEMGFHQETLTYYQGDDIMADVSDNPIYNYQGLMGELKFGHGSKDPGVVYIRNEVLHMEWEILLHQGLFEQEVMGLKMEGEVEEDLRHSVQKFRRD